MSGPRVTGSYESIAVGGEKVDAFVPHPLPPAAPPLAIDPDMALRVRVAEEKLHQLELAGKFVPSLDWFIYGFVRKEAVVSSQIEGTQATLVDLLNFEAGNSGGSPVDPDLREVCNYLEALDFVRGQLRRDDGLPISTRLLNEAHARLMQGARGADKLPGEIRRTQNWIGGTRPGNAAFVPPPPHLLPRLLSDFEHYLHTSTCDLPPLVRAGLLHVQFETIHTYLDGNGRIGRLLIMLLLEQWGLLSAPLLYLSLYFKRHRDEYYRRLAAVRSEGDWEGWIRYFLEGVALIAEEAVATARDLFALVARDRQRVLTTSGSTVMAAQLFEMLPQHPVVTALSAMRLLQTTRPTAAKAMATLVEAGVLRETSGKKRDRVFAYASYLDLLRPGTSLEA